jgi:alpha-galactosidase
LKVTIFQGAFMAKIAIIGAGGHVFPLRLAGDILSFPALQNSTIALMDIDRAKLERTEQSVRELVAHHDLGARVEATLDRRAALRGADYVIVTFQVGGLEAYRLDVEIPRQYGVDQAVGDTLGPGGIMRFLRSSAVLQSLAEDMLELCPKALLINYANPMAMNCWFLSRLGIKTVGLCHSVQNTTHMLAKHIDIPIEDITYKSAGINHQAWLLEFKRGHEDLYPAVRQVMRQEHLERDALREMLEDHGDHSQAPRQWTVYEGGQERVRTTLMDTFGYFHTESSHHASEYVPWFRKDPEMVQRYIPERWDYYQICSSHDDGDLSGLLAHLKTELRPSHEYGAQIIQAIETGQPAVIYGNVPNTNLIPNLPEGCCVEVACLVDKNGIQPTHAGPLPLQLAALNRTNIHVQELAVEAAITGNQEHVHHAMALDPLTSALLTLDQIKAMTNELLGAQANWLPQFNLELARVVAADD